MPWPDAVDLTNAREYQGRLDAYFASAGLGDVLVLDLGGTGFIDSTGIGVLISARAAAERKGVELHVDDVGERVLRVIEVTGLRELFDLRNPAAS